MGTYRDADEERAQEAEHERVARLEVEAREHAADLDVIRKMRAPLHGVFAPARARNALIAAGAAFVLPIAPVLVAGAFHEVRDTAIFAAFVLGGLPALTAIALGVRSALGQTQGRGWGAVAIVAGLLALPWAFLCGVVVSLMGWRMGE